MKRSARSKMRVVLTLAGAAAWLNAAVAMAESSTVEARTISGKAYDGEHLSSTSWPEPLYSVSLTSEKGAGIDRLRFISTDRRGQAFFTQTVEFEGDTPKAYSFSNTAARQEGKLSVTPNELIMEFTDGGKTRTATKPRPNLFAVGPSIGRIIEKHLAELSAGKTINFDLVVVSRLTTYAVRITRETGRTNDSFPQVKSGQWIMLRTEPQSALARAFAPTIFTIVDARTGRPRFVSAPIASPEPGGGNLKRGTIHYGD